VSEWAQVGPPPGETSALLVARMLREAGAPTEERQDAGFDAPTPLSAVSGIALVPEPPPAGARRPQEDTTELGSW